MKSKYELIEDGTYKKFLEKYKEYYYLDKSHNDVDLLSLDFGIDVITLFKIKNAQRQRKKRYMNELIKWYFVITNTNDYKDYQIVFITLTFTDRDFEKLSKQTRRRYVQKFLRENTTHYIANIDYGSESDREHYHAIAMIREDIDLKRWKRMIKIQRVPIQKSDIKKTLNYLLKLNNHAYKESTRNSSILQDKNINDYLDKKIDLLWSEEYYKFKIYFNALIKNSY